MLTVDDLKIGMIITSTNGGQSATKYKVSAIAENKRSCYVEYIGTDTTPAAPNGHNAYIYTNSNLGGFVIDTPKITLKKVLYVLKDDKSEDIKETPWLMPKDFTSFMKNEKDYVILQKESRWIEDWKAKD